MTRLEYRLISGDEHFRGASLSPDKSVLRSHHWLPSGIDIERALSGLGSIERTASASNIVQKEREELGVATTISHEQRSAIGEGLSFFDRRLKYLGIATPKTALEISVRPLKNGERGVCRGRSSAFRREFYLEVGPGVSSVDLAAMTVHEATHALGRSTVHRQGDDVCELQVGWKIRATHNKATRFLFGLLEETAAYGNELRFREFYSQKPFIHDIQLIFDLRRIPLSPPVAMAFKAAMSLGENSYIAEQIDKQQAAGATLENACKGVIKEIQMPEFEVALKSLSTINVQHFRARSRSCYHITQAAMAHLTEEMYFGFEGDVFRRPDLALTDDLTRGTVLGDHRKFLRRARDCLGNHSIDLFANCDPYAPSSSNISIGAVLLSQYARASDLSPSRRESLRIEISRVLRDSRFLDLSKFSPAIDP